MLRLSVDGNILRGGDDTHDRSLHPPSKLRRRSRPFSLRDEEEEEDAAHTRGKMWPSHLLFAAAQKPPTLSAIMTRARAKRAYYYAKCASVRGRSMFLSSFWQKGSLNAGEAFTQVKAYALEVWNGEGCKFDQSRAPPGGGTHLAPDTFSPSSSSAESSSLSPTVLSMSTFAHSSVRESMRVPRFCRNRSPESSSPLRFFFRRHHESRPPSSPIPSRVSLSQSHPPSGCLLGNGKEDWRELPEEGGRC